MNATPRQYVGIDVAQAVLDVVVRPSGATWQVPNTDAGITEVVHHVGALGPVLVVCTSRRGAREDLEEKSCP